MLINKKYLDEELKKLIFEPLYKKKEREKRNYLYSILKKTIFFHYRNCSEYKKICQYFNFNPKKNFNLNDLPYLTSSVFKNNLIFSVSKSKVFRKITSSATTSNQSSNIILDKENNLRWSLSLKRMFIDRVGDKKYNVLFLDTKKNLNHSTTVSARSSMLKSFLFLANSYNCCLSEKNNRLKLNIENVINFFKKNKNKNVMIFGFTYILYKYFLKILDERKIYLNVKNLIIVHAGGWKKLEDEKISKKKLSNLAKKVLNISEDKIIDIYGFSEQGGLLYPTCEKGFRHCTNYSTLLVRGNELEPINEIKKIGFLQFITPIQLSYPGHSFLTEDVGRIEGIDDCRCGRLGIYFRVFGRYKHETEIRGCGDVMAINTNG